MFVFFDIFTCNKCLIPPDDLSGSLVDVDRDVRSSSSRNVDGFDVAKLELLATLQSVVDSRLQLVAVLVGIVQGVVVVDGHAAIRRHLDHCMDAGQTLKNLREQN